MSYKQLLQLKLPSKEDHMTWDLSYLCTRLHMMKSMNSFNKTVLTSYETLTQHTQTHLLTSVTVTPSVNRKSVTIRTLRPPTMTP